MKKGIKSEDIIIFSLVIIIIFLLVLNIRLDIKLNSLRELDKLNNNSFIESLEIINKNCGSTFITQKYNNPEWYIYSQNCLENGYCKNEYIKLETCLLGRIKK